MSNARRDIWEKCIPPNLLINNTVQILSDIIYSTGEMINDMKPSGMRISGQENHQENSSEPSSNEK